MRDELAHIRNEVDEHRKSVLAQHDTFMMNLYAHYPDLKHISQEIDQVRKAIITTTLEKLSGKNHQKDIYDLEQKLVDLRNKRIVLLKQKNINPDSLQPKWNCALCQDTGKVYIDDNTYKLCTCTNASNSEFLRSKVNLPQRLMNASFDLVNTELYPIEFRVKATNAFDFVKMYCNNFQENRGKGLFIQGPTGTGKSYMLGCIANYLYSKVQVRYIVYADFLDNLRASFNPQDSGFSEQQMVNEIKNTYLLLLDDLGVEKPTDFALKYLSQIIDYRYRNFLPIVVTSNFTLNELKKRNQSDVYGERIVWRLNETCSIINLEGNLRLNL